MTAALVIPALVSAVTSVIGTVLENEGKGDLETKNQKKQSKLLDDVIGSLSGKGPFKDLYSHDEGAFQKSFVDPAKSLFKNQIAPQIQQSFIASGQQRGTGLDDQLLRAGVDLDEILNQHMMQYQEGAKNRGASSINALFGVGPGAANSLTGEQAAKQGLAGYFSSDNFSDTITNLMKEKPTSSLSAPMQPGGITTATRKGFAPDTNINFGTPVRGY